MEHPSDKGSSDSEEMRRQGPASLRSTIVKTCADCGTTKTPLWRGGPAGPKSLCNACGIRSRKRRRALLVLNKNERKSKKNGDNYHNQRNGNESISTSCGSVRRKLFSLGREMSLQRPRSTLTEVSKQRKKLGEEEQAAFLLMALSCGSVYA